MSDKENTLDEEFLEDELLEGETQEQKAGDEKENVEEEKSVEETLSEELAKEKDKFLRLFAEFENYKRRTSKERMELFKTAGQEVIVSLLPVLDDFDRAMKELAKSDDKEVFKGVELINVKFRETLKAKGLEMVEVNAGDVFDAEIHEAITQIPAPDKKMKGKVIDVIEKGFKLGDRIIRHPKVVVGN
ncbi:MULTISPECIES: nucleotide exchange factor GrpE [Maribacter]|jgi:molecular chaperone GrpE|uniref:Protein GrpE n=1 Tax=Maribacter dokdonensis TaxID=320912 RepID=A0ABY0UMB9_9FLAO|nr:MULTISPECIES: nucleotide exchange factor GrpE [Maribacter]HAF77539.1 nucleotide exchange factor GrpE [Maribacter sp.]APA65182.1 molecular chaperone GrpE [Maribacter sp. 1_2014MBL_MicDiv]KSA14649.1 Protein GrpE [Maribacter dokdonensis DSW-8]PHN93986.1 nucleotide exchange factor GrpE [Maribacter sp. 6B07]CAG2531422.1 molecular chaperone GrpE [Maribacter dokdonensis]